VFKALFLSFDHDKFTGVDKLLAVARAEASKILGVDMEKVKVLNILYCPYPTGYVVVVKNSGRRMGKEKLSES